MGGRGSGQQLADHLAVDVGQAEISALESVSQLLVVDAQAVQHGGIEVVDVHGILRML